MQHSRTILTTNHNEHTSHAILISNIYACVPIHKRKKVTTRTAWFSLAKDISLVLVGLRCAILVDHVVFDLEEAKDFITKLTQQFTEYPPICGIVTSHKTLFIVSFNLLQERLSRDIQDAFTLIQFVKVDRVNKRPSMLDVEHHSIFTKQLKVILDQLQPQLQQYTLHQSIIDITELVDDSMLITLTGWLLEYPAIYIQTSLNDGNCLSAEPLWLIRAFGSTNNEDKHEHLLHSFSVPCLLFESTVQSTSWFESWRSTWHQRISQQEIWHQLRISIEQVTLPAVAL